MNMPESNRSQPGFIARVVADVTQHPTNLLPIALIVLAVIGFVFVLHWHQLEKPTPPTEEEETRAIEKGITALSASFPTGDRKTIADNWDVEEMIREFQRHGIARRLTTKEERELIPYIKDLMASGRNLPNPGASSPRIVRIEWDRDPMKAIAWVRFHAGDG